MGLNSVLSSGPSCRECSLDALGAVKLKIIRIDDKKSDFENGPQIKENFVSVCVFLLVHWYQLEGSLHCICNSHEHRVTIRGANAFKLLYLYFLCAWPLPNHFAKWCSE